MEFLYITVEDETLRGYSMWLETFTIRFHDKIDFKKLLVNELMDEGW